MSHTTPPSYHGRKFSVVENSPTGESGSQTVFTYRQQEDIVWATYEGGEIRFGTLVGTVTSDGGLDFRYSHISRAGARKSGVCQSRLEVLPDGRYRLHETWRWTDPPGEPGQSIAEEIQ